MQDDAPDSRPASSLPEAPRPDGWERRALERLAGAALQEQRRARRWSIFFRLVSLALLLAFANWLFAPFGGTEVAAGGRHTALVSLEGVLDAGDVKAEDINEALRAAFEDGATAGVILRINSPGGSPVQAGLIYDEIRRLRAKHPDKPLYAVVEETCASGGYYVAAAADRIYVDQASLVGSIGVLMDGFGATGLLEKLGVERRLLTAGENKGFLDPFSPVTPDQMAHAKGMLAEIHRQFIDAVKKGRGERLKDDPTLFTGLFWTGTRSVELGLADALGSVDMVAREVVGAQDVVDFSYKENLVERVARRIGAEAGRQIGARLSAGGGLPALR